MLHSLILTLLLTSNVFCSTQMRKFAKRDTIHGDSVSTSDLDPSEANILQFLNVGYEGSYYPVTKVEATNSENCTCEIDTENPTEFEGALSPLNEELSVHIRGPLNLLKFGWYVSSSYEAGQSTGNWTRMAYYDAVEGTATNVTFLGNVGTNNLCLGQALDYVDSTGLKAANSSTILSNTTIPSAREYAIFSGLECENADDCGVYRADAKAYHGFYGLNKMFLFEFKAPSDLSEETKVNKTDNYDLSAIWLLNAQIPRTSQYPTNGNCSAWNSGAGEFDIFEVMNVTDRNNFYSTIHDFQGTGEIGTGLQNFAYLQRTPNATMKGGVVFGEDGSATVFLSNSTTFGSTLDTSDLETWLSDLESNGTIHEDTLESVTRQSSASSSSTSTSTKTSKADANALVFKSSSSYFGWFSTFVSIVLGSLFI